MIAEMLCGNDSLAYLLSFCLHSQRKALNLLLCVLYENFYIKNITKYAVRID